MIKQVRGFLFVGIKKKNKIFKKFLFFGNLFESFNILYVTRAIYGLI